MTTVTAVARTANKLAPAGSYAYSETNLDAKMKFGEYLIKGHCKRLFHTIARMIRGRD